MALKADGTVVAWGANAHEAPVMDSLVSLSATVHDPHPGDSLSLAWTASGGSFSDSSSPATSWTAPSATGVQTLTLTV
ncbi:uncharacterized protein STAUR_8364 [Stigmatella aurantiaca DW4/3-1]|uniref:Uncharacterized protein n=1 Tax=Stigmatella aurantiaca (strain DW4/3-1) TaxID=378806 RepID=Q093B8_STIAD|nr:hypothetical protein [Stigmatella aurantiaca]ADO76118.1 uncharacterized protein STAUR_8364 [Stigmatella aurantiaca DW4/3-1]EAU66854.1 hypothetical protein STIAU_3045 [Stigmatella aurantiaca DW4/3-1]